MANLLNVLYLLLLVFVSPLVFWRRWRHGRYRRGWREKILGPSLTIPSGQPFVWLHAVSVGEVQVLRTLVETFESERPDLGLAISVSTDSGMELAEKLFAKHHVFFAPFDFSWSIRRAFEVINPSLIVLTELELWPNWLLQAERVGCPVVVINGRLSESSFIGYSRIPIVVKRCMQSLDWVGAQSEVIATRFRQLGVPNERVSTTGNVKFDGATGDRSAPEITMRKELLDIVDGQTVLLAGSTQSPEESIVIGAFVELAARYPQLKLLLVPRHAERFEEVARLIDATGLPWLRRSDTKDAVSHPNWRIFLGDSVGELRWWWGLADIGFVGGSFGDRGGQNMIEPCAFGVATSFGPNTRNFSDIVHLLIDEHACEQLQRPEELQSWIESILVDSEKRKTMASQAIQVCRRHRGANQRSWENLKRFLPAQPDA